MLAAVAFLKAYWQARHQRFGTREALEAHQNKRVIAFLTRVQAKSPFYRQLWAGLKLEQWRQFPLMDKKLMMANFSTLNTAGIDREQAFETALRAEQLRDFSPTIRGITIGLSSGTSGHRGLFLVSKQEQASWAGMVLGKLLPESLFFGKRQRIAFFLRANSNLYEEVNRAKISFQFYDLMQELESHYARLEQQNPTMLIAPASVLKMLAHAVWSGKLRMCPRKIIAVAEVLEPFDRDYIASIFHSTVHQVYQCTEGFLGVTCEHGTLHLNESRVLIEKEVIDADNHRFVPIITDFSRFTQPFVRYRLNDVLRERTTPCPCGSAELAIEAIEGRCDDVLYLQSATQTTAIRPIFADFIRRAIMQVDLPIDEYAVEQTAIDRLQIHILCDESLFAQINVQLQLQFEGLFQQLGVQMPTVTIDNKFSLPARGDKLRRIRRTFEWEGAL